MLGVQLKAAIEFLKHYGRDLDGYPNHLFDTIEICPQGQVEHNLVAHRVATPDRCADRMVGTLRTITGPVLREKWTNGEHLKAIPRSKSSPAFGGR